MYILIHNAHMFINVGMLYIYISLHNIFLNKKRLPSRGATTATTLPFRASEWRTMSGSFLDRLCSLHAAGGDFFGGWLVVEWPCLLSGQCGWA